MAKTMPLPRGPGMFALLLTALLLGPFTALSTEHFIGVVPGDDKTMGIRTTEIGERHDLIVRNDNHPASHDFVIGKDPGEEIVASSDTALWERTGDTVHTKNYTVQVTQPGHNLWLHLRVSFVPKAAGGGGPAPAPPDADIRVPGAFLVSLTFSGGAPGEFHPVFRDPHLVPGPIAGGPPDIVDDELYPDPHWHRDRIAANEPQSPICYIRSTPPADVHMVVSGEWELVPAEAWPDGPYEVTGHTVVNQVAGAVLVQGTATAAGGTLTLTNAVFADPLADTVDYDENLRIHWMISRAAGAQGAQQIDAGRSGHQRYVLLGEPLPSVLPSPFDRHLWHSLVHLACAHAKDENDMEGVLEKIWEQFEGRQVARHDETELSYYLNWRNGNFGTAQMLAHGDSECSGFATLLLHSLRVHGLADGEYFHFSSRFSGLGEGFMVNEWDFSAPGTSAWEFPDVPNFPEGTHMNTFSVPPGPTDDNSFLWTSTEVPDQPGMPGQNSANPASAFGNHQIVIINIGGHDRYYDPSYGMRFNRLRDIQRDSIAGFFRVRSHHHPTEREFHARRPPDLPADPPPPTAPLPDDPHESELRIERTPGFLTTIP